MGRPGPAMTINSPLVRRVSRGFDAVGESVRAAREFLAATVEDWQADDLEWPLIQSVSELACNAVIHAKTLFTVTLEELDAGGYRLGVTDASPRLPQPRHYGAESTTGRGLRLVEQMSRGWGVETTEASKTVWAEFDASPVINFDVDGLLDAFDVDDPSESSAKTDHRHQVDEAMGGAGPSVRTRELVGA
jgi:hypothetical protein